MRNALHDPCTQQEMTFLSIHSTASYIRYIGARLFFHYKNITSYVFFHVFFRLKFKTCRGCAGVDVPIYEKKHSP